jgi:glycosyltransferase involved in cell wall biosynthesis
MKILHLNYYDIEGGAAVAMYRLHQLLKKNKNIESNLLVFSKKKDMPDIISSSNIINKKTNYLKRKLCFQFTKYQKVYSKSTHSLNIFSSGILNTINKIKPDIVHLHWVNNEFISIKEISRIDLPTVWTFYDMWPMCGAEHYTADKRYIEGYNKENRPIENNGIDLNKFIWKLKYENWKNKDFKVVCLSEWHKKEANKSKLFKNYIIETIPPPIDFLCWKDIPKKIAQGKLKLDNSKIYLLFGAANGTNDRRKGFDLLIEILNKNFHNNKKIHLLTFGNISDQDRINLKIPTTNLGHIKYDDYEKLRLIYSASNLTLLPSKLEAFGQVGLESLACKTPLISFRNTGPEDMIEHKKNGYLSNYLDKEDFSNGIKWYLDLTQEEIKTINDYSRQSVLKKFDEKIILDKYLKIYNSFS